MKRTRFLLSTIVLLSIAIIFGCQSKVKIGQPPPPLLQTALETKGAIPADLPTAGLLPSELEGKQIFNNHCATCHGVDGRGKGNRELDLAQEAKMRKAKLTDLFRKVSASAGPHAGMSEKLSVLDRWSAIMYLRTFYTHSPLGDVEFERKFGRNCATCHGTRGHGDGPISHGLVPKPANFTNLERMFDDSDEEIFKVISQGAYPSAMPPWQDVEGMTDPKERWRFVDYVRSFSYKPAKIEKEEKE